MYIIFVKDNAIMGSGECHCINEDVENIEVSEELYNSFNKNPLKYIYSNGEIILDPAYEEHEAERERERVGKLQVTKRVFALALQELGIPYAQLKELISTNEQAQLEWDLCVELQRSNPLLDVMASYLGVSSETIDMIFKKANGEGV